MDRDELMAMYDSAGKTFVVTGGAGALGSDVVVALASCGASAPAKTVFEKLGFTVENVATMAADLLG